MDEPKGLKAWISSHDEVAKPLTAETLNAAFDAIRNRVDDRPLISRDLGGGAVQLTRANPIFVSPQTAENQGFRIVARWYYGEISRDEMQRQWDAWDAAGRP